MIIVIGNLIVNHNIRCNNSLCYIFFCLQNVNSWINEECVISHIDNVHGLSGRFKMAHPIVLGYKVNETKVSRLAFTNFNFSGIISNITG